MSEHTALDIAKAHRAALMGRIARLSAERRRLSAVEGAEREARAALDALGCEEAAAARAWAASGAETSAPPVDAERRRVLTAEVAHAEAATAAARGGGAAIDTELADATREAAGLAVSIERAAIDEMASTFLAGIGSLQALAATFRGEVARTFAIVAVLRDRAEDHQAHGRHDEARRMFVLLERIGAVAGFDTTPTRAEVATHTAGHAATLAGLLS